MRPTLRIAALAVAMLGASRAAHAQALGPQRQFLAVEPYYERTQFDAGPSSSKVGLNGFGARLWVNLDPFHFVLNSSLSLYGSHAPAQSGKAVSLWTFGGEYNQFFFRHPLLGFIDPFLSAGVGSVRVTGESPLVYGRSGIDIYHVAIPVGGGIRIAIPNRFELRGDIKDQVIFQGPSGVIGVGKTTQNLTIQGGLGITF